MTTLPYLDEDFQGTARRTALAHAGFHVLTSGSAGMNGRTDLEQLRFATAGNRLIVTHNQGDFVELHGELMNRGEQHGGICIVRKVDAFGPGEIARRLLALQSVFAETGTRDQLLFLANFG